MKNQELTDLLKKLKSSKDLFDYDEAATKQFVILPILSYLGWNVFDINEIKPEYSVGGGKVDYSLRSRNQNKTFIEVKRIKENLEDHQEQLLSYSFKVGVKISILTNGVIWWFFLPLKEGNWENRRFFTIDIYEQNTTDITQKFIDFLSKDNVISGKAFDNAEYVYKSNQREIMIRETLPRAFHKLISEPDELLMELVAETTEKLCGYKPNDKTVKNFLKKLAHHKRPQWDIPSEKFVSNVRESTSKIRDKKKIRKSTKSGKTYTYKTIVAFTFDGKRYKVKYWKDLLSTLVELLSQRHKNEFDKVLEITGRKKPYFSLDKEELRSPEKINHSEIYYETNLSASYVVKVSRRLITKFGYKENDLSIEMEDK
jgi:hypothetical protein